MNAAPVTGEAFGLVRVMVSTATSLVPIEAGANDLAMLSAESTVSDPLPATVLAPALVEVSAPAAIALL